ncbi:hypothetical protein BSKO_01929 [Bryopsis sp. KO-2023]|nr:hypothetical protein BSKO_01929 [Bryopsis sp. KO-2023]
MERRCQPRNSLLAVTCCFLLVIVIEARPCGNTELSTGGKRTLNQQILSLEDCEVLEKLDFPAAVKLNNGNKDIVESADKCCALCKATEDCATWTFMKTAGRGKSAGSCWLKLADSTTADCKECISGIAPESATRIRMRSAIIMNSCIYMESLNFDSQDVDTLSAPITENLRECCDLCQMRPDCKAWTRLYDGRCFMRSSVKAPSICEHCEASGVVDGRPRVEEIRALMDFLDLVSEGSEQDSHKEAAVAFLGQVEKLTGGN